MEGHRAAREPERLSQLARRWWPRSFLLWLAASRPPCPWLTLPSGSLATKWLASFYRLAASSRPACPRLTFADRLACHKWLAASTPSLPASPTHHNPRLTPPPSVATGSCDA